MHVSIEKNLCFGTAAHIVFSVYDDIKLKLKSGEIVRGLVEGFEGYKIVKIATDGGMRNIDVDEIEGYI